MTISVVISAYNEEKNIKRAIKSAKLIADEIIVVDNSSTDNTAKIAKQQGAKVFKRQNNPQLNINKNFGLSKSTKDWVFLLDADEEITEALSNEVKKKIESTNANGFKIPRKNFIFNKWVEHTGWYPDYQTRLFRKGKGKFAEVHNHEQAEIEGEVQEFTNPLIHHHYKSIDEFLKKTILLYTDNEKEAIIKSGYIFKHKDLIARPFNEFISRYFARQGYKDGIHGLVLSLLMSFYHFIVMLKIWEENKFSELSQKSTDEMIKNEVNYMKKELKYWAIEKNIQNAHILKKNILRVTRRLS